MPDMALPVHGEQLLRLSLWLSGALGVPICIAHAFFHQMLQW